MRAHSIVQATYMDMHIRPGTVSSFIIPSGSLSCFLFLSIIIFTSLNEHVFVSGFDLFYYLLAILGVLNFSIFLVFARSHQYTHGTDTSSVSVAKERGGRSLMPAAAATVARL